MATFPVPGDVSAERPLPRGISVRRGTEYDEFPTFDVMRRAMGYEMNWSHHAAMRAHLRTTAHASFWVAEETPRFGAARIVGYARSLVRERVWSLTEFFVLPGSHRKGIGGALLTRCLEDGVQAGADTRLVLASQNPAAVSLYIRKAGCVPRLPMLLLAGPKANLRVAPQEAASVTDTVLPPLSTGRQGGTVSAPLSSEPLRAEPLILTPEVAAELDALDRRIVGYARPQEHAHWVGAMGGPQGASRLFRRPAAPTSKEPGPLAGYAYIGAYASGPTLAVEPADQPRMIAHVAAVTQALAPPPSEFALPTAADQYCAVCGINETVLRWLPACGWQIIFHYLFMSTRPLGQLDRYVCHNPLYVL
jgi:GNAT superfamily N-acetyltransferase